MLTNRLWIGRTHFGPKLAAWMVLAASSVLLFPWQSVAEGHGPSCRALYVSKLKLARDATARGDQQAVVEGLQEAQDVLRFCTEDPSAPGGARHEETPAHVLSRSRVGGSFTFTAG